jgi:DNA-binding CsgD family transcriptional regulator
VLSLVGEVLGLLDLEELSQALLEALRRAVPAEWCALNEVPADLPGAISLTDPPVPAEMHAVFARYAPQNPIAAYFIRTGEGRATRFSDLVTRRQLHRLELYRRVYLPLGTEYQIAFTLPSVSQRLLGVALSRTRHDFTSRERDLLNLARPFLIQIYRDALAHADTGAGAPAGRSIPLAALNELGLTRRQSQVLRLVAGGQTAPQAAATLGIAPRTAQKHLEHCYRTLGVSSRGQASRIAWNAAAAHAAR